MPKFMHHVVTGDDTRLEVSNSEDLKTAKLHAQWRDNDHNARNPDFPRNTVKTIGPANNEQIEAEKKKILETQPHMIPADQLENPQDVFKGPQHHNIDGEDTTGADEAECKDCP